MADPGTFLDRMRANAAMALAEGATPAQVHAHLLAVSRGNTRPSGEDYVDGVELAEKADVLNGIRSHQPGTVPDGD